jgi:hypothetical protein
MATKSRSTEKELLGRSLPPIRANDIKGARTELSILFIGELGQAGAGHQTDETTTSAGLSAFGQILGLEGSRSKVVKGAAEPVALETCQALLADAGEVVDDILVAIEGRYDVLAADQAAELLACGAESEEGLVVQTVEKH